MKLERIWARGIPLRGTIGEKYLLGRGCVIPPADGDLRFMAAKTGFNEEPVPSRKGFPPSLVALVTDAVTNKPMTLHFTKLAADGSGKAGTDRDRILLKGYPKRGGVIRLWPDESVTDGLGIAEGIETALSAAHAFSPVWATVDAGNMAVFPVLDGVEALTIFADRDEAGLKAARACGQRWAKPRQLDAVCDVRLVVPRRGDVNGAIARAS